MIEKLTSCRNLLTGSGDTDDNALTPTLVAGLESSTHDSDIARAVECVVTSTVRHLDELLLDTLAVELGWVDKVRRTEFASPFFLLVIDVDHDDPARLVLHCTLNDGQTDTAGAKHGHIGSLLNLGGNDSRTISGRDTTTQQASTVGGGLGSHRHHGDVRNDGVLGEGRGTHEMQDVLAAGPEAGGAIGHETLSLRSPDLTAEVGLTGLAELALTALGGAVIPLVR